MKRSCRLILSTLLFLIITIFLFTTSIAAGATTFEDEFDGVVIDSTKWNTSIATSGNRWCSYTINNHLSWPGNWQNVEVEPWYGLTQAAPYGAITVGGGQASFSSEGKLTFPYIWSGPPSRISPFPSLGDFILEVRMKYDWLTYHGSGFVALPWENSDPVGNNPPAPPNPAALSVWGDIAGLRASAIGVEKWVSGDPLGFHDYRSEYVGGRYSLFIDGALEVGPITSDVRPNTIWIGHPVFTHWGLSDWSDFTVDFVRATIPNESPVVEAGGPYVEAEGSTVTFDASGSADPDGDALQYRWDFNSDGIWDTEWSSIPTAGHTWADNYSGTVKLEVSDGKVTGIDTATVIVDNVAPKITSISAPVAPVAVGTAVQVSGAFTDAGTLDTHIAIWDWGDTSGSAGTVTESGGSGTASGLHVYNVPGVYAIQLSVTDKDGASDTATYQYIVVYDPNVGFATGGGWINSPMGAYVPDPLLTGKATFGFVSKYAKGATVPTGQTQFQFSVADLNFHSASYEWLVVSGNATRAQYKGSGTINGQGDYGFLLTG